LGRRVFFFFGRESTDVERCKLFPNLNFHSSLTPHASESHDNKLIPTILNPLSDADENANVSVFFGSAKASVHMGGGGGKGV